MRTVKPQRLGVLHRTVENGGKFYFVPSALVAFRYDAPDLPVHEAAMWKAITVVLAEGAGFDEAMRKERCEVLVLGSAHPPGGEAAIGCEVRLRFGTERDPVIDKRLYVIGDRAWGPAGMSDPVPFTAMPTGYDRAFGGEGFGPNPVGRGYAPLADDVHALPNVEDPKRLISSPGDRPTPVSLGPRDIRVDRRQARAGTYDDDWLANHYPGFPPDFDWTFFNQAAEDQWLKGDLEGGERFLVEGMHPGRPRQEGRCPRLRPRCFITRLDDPALEEVPLRFDTVWLLPNDGLGVAVYRGLARVTEDDAADLTHLMLAVEGRDQPKPLEHYADVLRRRTEGDDRGLAALEDQDLLPPLPPGTDPMGMDDLGADELAEALGKESLLAVHQRARAEAILEATKAAGGTVPEELTADVSADGPTDLAAMAAKARAQQEASQAQAEAQRAQLEEELRAALEASGRDYDEAMKEARRRAAGPPTFDPEEALAQLQALKQLSENAGVPLPEVERQLADPRLAEKLREQRSQLVDGYRRSAHWQIAAVPLEGEEASALRDEVRRARDAGEDLTHRDLTGADLHGLDLSGIDLTGAFLDAANLQGCVLRRATLNEAVLSRTDLTDADLSGASARDANLGGATLVRTQLVGADLTGAILSDATLEEAVLDEACLDRTQWLKTEATRCRFVRATARGIVASNLHWTEADFTDAELPELVLIQSELAGACFRGANLEAGCFVEVKAPQACFDGLRGASFRVVYESDLRGASFRRADLRRAVFRGTELTGACFDEADLTEGDISEAILEDARLERMVARRVNATRTRFHRASLYGSDLMEAILGKAHLNGSDLSRSNLFRADLFRVHVDGATKLDAAHTDYMRFKERPDG